jgi:hypothetical protein
MTVGDAIVRLIAGQCSRATADRLATCRWQLGFVHDFSVWLCRLKSPLVRTISHLNTSSRRIVLCNLPDDRFYKTPQKSIVPFGVWLVARLYW